MLRKTKLKGHSFYNTSSLVEIFKNTFKLKTVIMYRVGPTDPSGGPMLVEGEPVEDTGIRIRVIKNY